MSFSLHGDSCLNRFHILNAYFMPDSSEGFNKSSLKEGALGNNNLQSCGLGTCFSNWDFQNPCLQRVVLGPPWECGEGCSQLSLLLQLSLIQIVLLLSVLYIKDLHLVLAENSLKTARIICRWKEEEPLGVYRTILEGIVTG